MKDDLFHFKQFSVRHNHKGLKVNTDAVLLGTLAGHAQPKTILEIGTGTGVIALMLAQRFSAAKIDAVESDISIAEIASINMQSSAFQSRVKVIPSSFQAYFEKNPNAHYDMIVSNPPFFLNSLKPDNEILNQAKHTTREFFEDLFFKSKNHLNDVGELWLILPPDTLQKVTDSLTIFGWRIAHITHVFSATNKPEFRSIICIKKHLGAITHHQFYLRNPDSSYHSDYKSALKEFLTIF